MFVEGIRSASANYGSVMPQGAASANVTSGSEQPTLTPVSELRYLSPTLHYDRDAGVAVLVIRDSASGVVENQYPSEKVVREYQLRSGDNNQVAQTNSADAVKTTTGAAQATTNALVAMAGSDISSVSGSGTPVVTGGSSGSSTGSTPASGSSGSSVNFVA